MCNMTCQHKQYGNETLIHSHIHIFIYVCISQFKVNKFHISYLKIAESEATDLHMSKNNNEANNA